MSDMFVRLQKHLADAGIASRRASERVILDGRVTVNGKMVAVLGTKIDPQHDQVRVDGVELKAKKKLYIAIHKPKGLICSNSDPEGRPLVVELLPQEWSGLYSVGRLDFNSEGLIFFTNDGDFSLKLTHPRYGVMKKYLVMVPVKLDSTILKRFTEGVYHEGDKLQAERARLLKSSNSGSVVEITLREGKNREVRRMFETHNIPVDRLLRTQIGAIKLGEMPRGRWRALTESEIKSLMMASR